MYAYTATPASGPFTITGTNLSIPIVFSRSPTYLITFTESGLISGAKWSVELELPNVTYLLLNSTSTTLAVSEPNGTYAYFPTAIGYVPVAYEGSFILAGGPVNVTVSFTKVYTVTFEETGLPSGTDWDVYYADEYTSSNTPSIVFTEPDGNYTYYLYDFGTFEPNVAISGSLNVSGANVVFAVTYSSASQPTYAVTVTETGLPTGTNWTVDLEGYYVYTTGTSLNFIEDNGSYYFYIFGGAGFTAAPSFGYIDVQGGPASQAIVFSQSSDTYLVTFTETGLPYGATWYVNITGETGLSATVSEDGGTTLDLALGNSTYDYQAAVNENNWTTQSTGSFTVAGAPLGVPVPFTSSSVSEYAVTFTESGLPSGSTWFVNITGEPGLSTTVSGSAGTTVAINLPNSTYNYQAKTSAKGWSTPSPGSFDVDGAAVNQPVPFTSSSAKLFSVMFTETGLPTGATWYINISGEQGLSATVSAMGGTQVSTSLVNGTYSFTATTDLKNWTAPSAHFSISGGSTSVTVAFTGPSSTSPPGTQDQRGHVHPLHLDWAGHPHRGPPAAALPDLLSAPEEGREDAPLVEFYPSLAVGPRAR